MMNKTCMNVDCPKTEIYPEDTELEDCPECGEELSEFDPVDYNDDDDDYIVEDEYEDHLDRKLDEED